jgi:YXWGXW repeat-containing protein
MRPMTDSAALARTAGDVRKHRTGAFTGTVRGVLLSLILAGGISSGSALARSIVIEVAPPPAQVEVVPNQRHGYTWAPGYWSWQRGHHVWVGGHTMRTRSGYEWSPDRWNQVDGRHQFEPGRWMRGSERHGQ